jgi:hypothetical protein
MSFVFEMHFDDALAQFGLTYRNQHEVGDTASLYFARQYLDIGCVRTASSKIKWFYSGQTQGWRTIISTLVLLHVSVFSRPSSGQHFSVVCTVDAHYTLWVPYCLQVVLKKLWSFFLSLKHCRTGCIVCKTLGRCLLSVVEVLSL